MCITVTCIHVSIYMHIHAKTITYTQACMYARYWKVCYYCIPILDSYIHCCFTFTYVHVFRSPKSRSASQRLGQKGLHRLLSARSARERRTRSHFLTRSCRGLAARLKVTNWRPWVLNISLLAAVPRLCNRAFTCC